MSARIHKTAIVEPGAEIGDAAEVGPYAVIGARVRIGARTRIMAHAVVGGDTTMGADNVLHPFTVVGGAPQTRVPSEGLWRTQIGDGNVFREHVTLHGGTDGCVTRMGDRNLIMVSAHLAHDVVLGSDCVLSNGVQLAGHVVVEDWVTFGGMSGIAQRVRIGQSAFVAAGAMVERDVPPFVIAQGDRARIRGLNRIGLERRGVPAASIDALERVYRAIWISKSNLEIIAQSGDADDTYVQALLATRLRNENDPGPT